MSRQVPARRKIEESFDVIKLPGLRDAVRDYGYNEVFDILAQKAAEKSHAHTYNEILVETMMFDLKGNLICESNGANTLLEELIR